MTPFLRFCIVGFLAYLSYTLARFPVIPLFAESLKLTPGQIGLVVGASTLTGVFFKMPSGALSDIFGRRVMMLTGICFFCFTPFFYFLAKDGISLFVIRIIHGFATAIFTPVASALISDLATEKNRGQLLSTFSSAGMIGRTLGPLLCGWLLFWGGFQLPFLASGVAGVIALILALSWPKEKKTIQRDGTTARHFFGGLRVVLTDKAILFISFVECVQYLANGALECFLPIYTKNNLHFLEWQIGILFGVQVIATMISKPFLGIMSDRFGRQPQICLGLLFGGMTYMLIPYLNSFFAILLLVTVYGLTIAIVTSATSAFVTDLSSRKNYGAAHGVFGTIMDTGHASGPILGGVVVSLIGYNFLFWIFGIVLAVFGVLFWFIINKLTPKEVVQDG